MNNLFDRFFPPEVLALATDASVDFALEKSRAILSPGQQRFLQQAGGIKCERLLNIRQVHGRRVLVLSRRSLLQIKSERKADGVLTADFNVPLSIRTADCLSIFIYDPKHQVIGLLHAGWKGTKKQIALRALEIMRKRWGTRPKDLLIAFGPSIKPCCYQVSLEFRKFFPLETKFANDQLCFDLTQANKNQLFKAGLSKKQIFDCQVCTCCHENYFSYRRQGAKAGRMLSVMMLKNGL